MKILKENMNYPYEGYFWIIDDSVVGITSEVPHYDYEYNNLYLNILQLLYKIAEITQLNLNIDN